MNHFKVHPKNAVVCVLATVFVLGDIPTAEAGCWLSKENCIENDAINELAMSLHEPRQAATVKRNFTVSTQGRTQIGETVLKAKFTTVGQSTLVMSEGIDGNLGDIALGVGNGGRMTMDLREDFLKIQYIVDF